jgi:hypothetical protein
MCDEILLHQLLEKIVTKMLASITYDCSRSTKRSEDSVLQNLDHNLVVIVLACNSLHPFRHIVHSNEDIEVAKGVWKRSHEINAPHIKNLNNQNGLEGHHILPRHTP